jgi:signal peptidase
MHRDAVGHARLVINVLLLAIAFGALTTGAYLTGTGRWHATPVLSGSMRPGLQPGDVVLTKRVPIPDLRVRDVIVFKSSERGDRLTVHRIVDMTPRDGSVSVTTRGDANSADDPTPSTLTGHDAYRVQRVVPLVGYPAVWLAGGNRGMLAIGLGLLLLVLAVVTALRKDPALLPRVSTEDSPASDPALR